MVIRSLSSSTLINRLTAELNRVIRELGLERDVLTDFQTKLDAAELVSVILFLRLT